MAALTNFDILVLLVGVLLYLLPTSIGAVRGVKGLGLLFVLNLFLGWTFLGWACCFFMSFAANASAERKRKDVSAISYSTARRRIEPRL